MSSMINLKASRKTPTINVGCNPVTNVHIDAGKDGPTMVRYPAEGAAHPPGWAAVDQGIPPAAEFVSVAPQAVSSYTASEFPSSDDPEKASLMRENAVLKLIIDIQHNNPLIVNKYIIADDATLVKLVALLCNATEVHIDAEDAGSGCMTNKEYRKVHSIYVVVDGKTKNLKYDFADVTYTLKELHISTKFVF